MTSSTNDDVTILTSYSERAPSITYRAIIISELFNTCPIHLGSKQSLQCIMTSSTNDDVIIVTADSERVPSITYIEIIISELFNTCTIHLGSKQSWQCI